MNEYNVIAIDLAKMIFQVCIMTVSGKILLNKSLKRKELSGWLARQELSLVVMESCGGANYWARLAKSLGHQVMVIPPRQVKPFRTGQKTDANDAVAIAIASKAPNVKPAITMTVEQQGLQSVDKMRNMLNKQHLQLSNQMRGLLLEFGIVIDKSVSSFKEKIPDILEDADNELPSPMRQSLSILWQTYNQLGEDYETLDSLLKELAAQDKDCQRLMKLEGVGPINAVKLKLKLGHEEHFKSGREAAACIGVTPKQHSSGGKVLMGSVAKKTCDQSLRSTLFLGARSVASKLKGREAKTEKECWLKRLVERRGVNCAAMALANKTIRTAYAMLKNNSEYESVAIAA